MQGLIGACARLWWPNPSLVTPTADPTRSADHFSSLASVRGQCLGKTWVKVPCLHRTMSVSIPATARVSDVSSGTFDSGLPSMTARCRVTCRLSTAYPAQGFTVCSHKFPCTHYVPAKMNNTSFTFKTSRSVRLHLVLLTKNRQDNA